MLISIIVPIYNVEKYIEECIKSVIKQTNDNYELILIDDGSTDGSGTICKKYSEFYDSINYIKIENGGVSNARNIGIKMARGEYLVFLDSDDYYIDDNFLDMIYKIINCEKPDIIMHGFTIVGEETGNILSKENKQYHEMNLINNQTKWLVDNGMFTVACWLHVVNKDFCLKNSLFFNTNLKTAEDVEWIMRVFSHKPKIYGMDFIGYGHRIRQNSFCTSKKESGFWKNRLSAINNSIEYISCKNNYDDTALYSYLAYQFFVLLGEIIEEPNDDSRKQAFKELSKIRYITKYATGKKEKLSRLVINVFGLCIGAKILNSYIKLKRKFR